MARDDGFPTTKWSLVLAARTPADPGSREALASLCEAYWYPLYVFLRRRGHDPDEARDLVQGLFVELLETPALRSVRPEAGRFRAFLLAVLKHHVGHEERKLRARKRGGGVEIVSLDAETAERRYRVEPQDPHSPEDAYERRWAAAVTERARRRLAEELEREGKGEQYRLLSGFLSGDRPSQPYSEVAARLDATEASVKMAVRRLRRRFGELLRDEIAQTVGDREQVDEELRHLLSVSEGA